MSKIQLSVPRAKARLSSFSAVQLAKPRRQKCSRIARPGQLALNSPITPAICANARNPSCANAFFYANFHHEPDDGLSRTIMSIYSHTTRLTITQVKQTPPYATIMAPMLRKVTPALDVLSERQHQHSGLKMKSAARKQGRSAYRRHLARQGKRCSCRRTGSSRWRTLDKFSRRDATDPTKHYRHETQGIGIPDP